VADVFISYSKSRRAETVELATDLEARGFTVWWDKEITPGETFRKAIRDELDKAGAVIVIWTPQSAQSNWVISEVNRAHKRGVLIAVHSPDLDPDDIPSPFDVAHTEPVANRAAILAALARLGVKPSGEPTDPLEPVPVPPVRTSPQLPPPWWRSRRAVVGGGAVAAVAAATAGATWFIRKSPEGPITPIHTLKGTQPVSTVAYTTDSRSVMSGGWDERLTLWDPVREEAVRRFEGHIGVVWCVVMLPDGAHALSSGDDGTLKLWSLTSPRPVREFKAHDKEIWSVALLPGGRQALSASLDATMKLWDLASPQQPLRTFPYEARILAVAVTPNGKLAVSAAKDVLQAWNIADGAKLHPFEGHKGEVNTVAIAPNGTQVVSGGDDGSVRLWELSSGRELHKLAGSSGHLGKVFDVAVSPNSRVALSGGADRTAKLWDLANARLIRTLEGHTESVETVAIAPDGRTAVTGSRDRTVKQWDLSGTGAS
jgi:TIR domain-containing protein/WD40 domain-containing protein